MSRQSDRDSFERMLNARVNKTQSKQVVTGYKSNVQGWRTIGGKKHFYRSLWEIQTAAYLEWLKTNKKIADWFYEAQLFQFPKDTYRSSPYQYLPDFKILELQGTHRWIEIKGYMTKAAKAKDKRFRKHYPNEILEIWSAKEMKEIAKWKALIPGWESFVPVLSRNYQ